MATNGMTKQQTINMHRAGLKARLRRLATLVEDAQRQLEEGNLPSGRLGNAAIDVDEHLSVLNALDQMDD